MLGLLGKQEACVGDLVAESGAERTNVSHQLRELRSCGLVATRQEGKRVYYRLAHPRLAEFMAFAEELATHIQCTDATACEGAGCC